VLDCVLTRHASSDIVRNVVIVGCTHTLPLFLLFLFFLNNKKQVRMTHRYLDIRRNPIKEGLLLRNKVTRHVRNFLNDLDFCEIETPLLIKSTPEGARDFVVPSRMNPGQFYALPQSPQTFKQVYCCPRERHALTEKHVRAPSLIFGCVPEKFVLLILFPFLHLDFSSPMII